MTYHEDENNSLITKILIPKIHLGLRSAKMAFVKKSLTAKSGSKYLSKKGTISIVGHSYAVFPEYINRIKDHTDNNIGYK